MRLDEFEKTICQDSNLIKPLQNTLLNISPDSKTRGTITDATKLASMVALFPVVIFIVKEIGLPWLYEAKRYSELWRVKFHEWVNQQYHKHGRDPEITKASGDALRRELEKINDDNIKESWERLAEKVNRENTNN